MTSLTTRFNHPFYADDVINLSITDLLDTRFTGQLAVSAVRAASMPDEVGVPFAFTEDLRLFVLTTPRHALSDHSITLPRMRLDVINPASGAAQQSLRLCGSWNAVSEFEYAEAVEAFASRFPTFDTTIGRFGQYQRMPLTIYKLQAEHLLLVDEVMFGPERLNVEVLRLKQPSAAVTTLPSPMMAQAAC
jgi:hypothetical protein